MNCAWHALASRVPASPRFLEARRVDHTAGRDGSIGVEVGVRHVQGGLTRDRCGVVLRSTRQHNARNNKPGHAATGHTAVEVTESISRNRATRSMGLQTYPSMPTARQRSRSPFMA